MCTQHVEQFLLQPYPWACEGVGQEGSVGMWESVRE
jgi:hypothetical protein